MRGEGLTKRFRMKGGLLGLEQSQLTAVDDVSFVLRKGQIAGIVGESGSGKSTLAKLLVHLERTDAGKLMFDGKDLLNLSEREFAAYRKRIQLIFQNPFSCLDPKRTIYDSLAEVLRAHHFARSHSQCREILEERLFACALEPEVLEKRPGEFSGGQLQRISIVRSLLTDPEILIADEITSALDVSVQGQILDMLLRLQQERGMELLFISHNLAVIRKICDYVYVMQQGRIVEEGETEEVFRSPQHAYTRRLLQAVIPFPRQE